LFLEELDAPEKMSAYPIIKTSINFTARDMKVFLYAN
jgi:hypothetical protein